MKLTLKKYIATTKADPKSLRANMGEFSVHAFTASTARMKNGKYISGQRKIIRVRVWPRNRATTGQLADAAKLGRKLSAMLGVDVICESGYTMFRATPNGLTNV